MIIPIRCFSCGKVRVSPLYLKVAHCGLLRCANQHCDMNDMTN
jgi:hypothetical protein